MPQYTSGQELILPVLTSHFLIVNAVESVRIASLYIGTLTSQKSDLVQKFPPNVVLIAFQGRSASAGAGANKLLKSFKVTFIWADSMVSEN